MKDDTMNMKMELEDQWKCSRIATMKMKDAMKMKRENGERKEERKW